MKSIISFLGLGLLLFGQPLHLRAQQNSTCRDMLLLHDGSRFRGQLEAYKPGDTVTFRLFSGLLLTLPSNSVKRIVQRCSGDKTSRPYSFEETGWYHHSRMGFLPGQTYFGANTTGLFIQHSSGWAFNRWLSAGLGAGAEIFSLRDGGEAATYPIFAEICGYLLPKRITPFYAVGAGWAFTGHGWQGSNRWNYLDSWKGGWMAQASIGYRIGNHLTIQAGLRLQRKDREWTSVWGPGSGEGVDRILQKRLLLGVGLLL